MSNKKRHLIILTRPNPYNGCGSADDEFVHLWKQNKSEKDPFYREYGDIKLTVIHGCGKDFTSTDSAELIRKVNNIVLDLLKKNDETLGILLHGIAEMDARAVIIPNNFHQKIEFVNTFSGEQKLIEFLAQKANDNPTNFLREFDAVWARFKLDWGLEAKLMLLHLCQTPKGAKNIISENCPPLIMVAKDIFWGSRIQIDDEFWKVSDENEEPKKTIEKAVEKLSQFKDDESFSQIYIEILKAIRITLLNGRN